jgi:hypothetical protein
MKMTLKDKEAFLARCLAAGKDYKPGTALHAKNVEQQNYWREEIERDKLRLERMDKDAQTKAAKQVAQSQSQNSADTGRV